VGRVLAEHHEHRGERVAQLVRRHAVGQRRLSALGEQLVGALDHEQDHPLARVRPVAWGAGHGGEGEVVRCGCARAQLVGVELVAQDREQLDLAYPGLGLGLADQQAAAGEVDVASAQRAGLADPQAGEDERGDQSAAPVGAGNAARVEVGVRVQQRLDRLGAVEEHRARTPGLELAVARVDADGVADDQVALFGDGEDLPEAGDSRGVDLGALDRLRPRARSGLRGGSRARRRVGARRACVVTDCLCAAGRPDVVEGSPPRAASRATPCAL
jgi:hypothetical protein